MQPYLILLQLVDCSEVIPKAIAFTGGAATLPPGQTLADIQASVRIILLGIIFMLTFYIVPHRCVPQARYSTRYAS